ncbi:MAG: hypothetical protein AAGC67_17090 [Myxococcota bacterium]
MTTAAHRLPARALALFGLALLMLSTSGCAFGEFRPTDPFDRQWTLDQAQHRYTVLVRFSDFERASAFVDAGHREDFTKRMRALEDARFTDYESETVELDDGKEKATVRVTYSIYTPALPYEIEVAEVQEWSRSGITNNWRVVSTFEGLQQIVAN